MDRTSSSGTDDSIPDISDREINTILTEISRTKGSHITFNLDCCYSTGNTRGPTNVQRGAVPLPPSQTKNMLEEAHIRLRDLPKYHSVFDGDWKPDVSSHVALAACKDYQTADEGPGTDDRWSGVFTQALIEALKSDSFNEESTYADLICALKIPRKTKQTPVVSGNASARLWYQGEVRQYGHIEFCVCVCVRAFAFSRMRLSRLRERDMDAFVGHLVHLDLQTPVNSPH